MKQKPNYAGYTNPELKDQPGRIFTREEIKIMKPDEYFKNEKAIYYQMNSIGIPSKQELENSQGVVHVNAYDKSDGTHVREHYRSWPEDHGSNIIESRNGTKQIIAGPEFSEQKPDKLPEMQEQENAAEKTTLAPLAGEISVDVAKAGIESGGMFGTIASILGVVGGIGLIIGGIIYTITHFDKVKKAGKEILGDLEVTLREVGSRIEENMPTLEKQLGGFAGGNKIVDSLKKLQQVSSSNSTKISFTDSDTKKQLQNSLETYKSISKDLLDGSRNILNRQDETQKKLLNEIAQTTDQSTYRNLMERYSYNKQMTSGQMSQISRMEYYIDNNQLDNLVSGSNNSILQGSVSADNYLGKTEQEWLDQAKQIEGANPNVRDDITPLIIDTAIMSRINPSFGISNPILKGIAQGSIVGAGQSALDSLKGLPVDPLSNILTGGILGGGFQLAGRAMGPVFRDLFQVSQDSLRNKAGYIILKGNYIPSYKQKLLELDKILVKNGYYAREHALNAITGRIHSGRLPSLEKIREVIKTGNKYIDHKGNLAIYKSGLSVHFDIRTKEIITISPRDNDNILKIWRKI